MVIYISFERERFIETGSNAKISFCFCALSPARHYKFDTRISNELLIINLAQFQADGFKIPVHRLERWWQA